MGSSDEQRQKLDELTQQRMTFLARVYELSDADLGKDILYDDIRNSLDVDDDACRKAMLYLQGQGMIEITSPALGSVAIQSAESQEDILTSSGRSEMLRITHKGIDRAEAEHRRKPKQPPTS